MKKLPRILIVVAVVALAWILRARAVDLLPIDYDEDDLPSNIFLIIEEKIAAFEL